MTFLMVSPCLSAGACFPINTLKEAHFFQGLWPHHWVSPPQSPLLFGVSFSAWHFKIALKYGWILNQGHPTISCQNLWHTANKLRWGCAPFWASRQREPLCHLSNARHVITEPLGGNLSQSRRGGCLLGGANVHILTFSRNMPSEKALSNTKSFPIVSIWFRCRETFWKII